MGWWVYALTHVTQQRSRSQWLIGFTLYLVFNVLGTIIQLASLPLIVLAPLGAISLLPNVVFARVLLKDKRRELLQGIVLIVIGATLIAYHSDVTPEQHLSYDRLMELFNRSVNQAYLAIQSLATLAALGVAHIWDRSRTQSAAEATPLIGEDRKARYNGPAVLFASCSGVLSGMCLLLAKGGIEGIIENSEWRVLLHWQIGLLLAVLAIAAVVQLYYLNLALKCSDPSLISPLAFCFYNVSSILNGLVFFDQYSHTSTTDLMTISAGTVTLLVGVWIVSGNGDNMDQAGNLRNSGHSEYSEHSAHTEHPIETNMQHSPPISPIQGFSIGISANSPGFSFKEQTRQISLIKSITNMFKAK